LKLKITIDGKAYAVDVEILEDEESPVAPAAGARVGAHATEGRGTSQLEAWDSEGRICRSPVMGLVIKVNVLPGQAVEPGELLVVLEAMKMETNMTAPHAGIVKSVHVKPGDPVKLDQMLLELE
jgi:methylmalonyl-CoA carboxyltransferase small subunit